jgi:SAM-dependent methyltransferase
MADDAAVQAHYSANLVLEDIVRALQDAGVDLDTLTPLELAPVDQFHSRGLDATKELGEMLVPKAEERLLDIGCGLGGPARFLAFSHGCRIDGIDLTPAFCEVARRLTGMTRLDDQVGIECASALDLPFEDGCFDAAYSQNVVMNIADKAAFYGEARRVLKPGGRLALSNLMQGPGGEPMYPVPWAETAATSFLSTPEATREAIEAAGFEILVFRNTTEQLNHFYQTQRERLRHQGPPKLGIHVFMGERIKAMQRNVAQNVEDGCVIPFEILCRKA